MIEKSLKREEAVSGPQAQANVNNETGVRTLVLMQVSADLNEKNIICQAKGSFEVKQLIQLFLSHYSTYWGLVGYKCGHL